MATLSTELGHWEVDHFHSWRDRRTEFEVSKRTLLSPDSRIATIGSCFASELAKSMKRLGLAGAMHPAGLFYNTRSIRQELEWIYADDRPVFPEPPRKLQTGLIHPFKSPYAVHATEEALAAWSGQVDQQAKEIFCNADIIVVTLGLIETWRNPATGLTYLQIPLPESYRDQIKESAPKTLEFHRLGVEEMKEDLEHIRALVREHTQAELILTVSPVPLHTTFTGLDVRVANSESKSRVRSAVSEFLDAHPEVHYFHSYELVTTAERASDFMLEDGRHVKPKAVDYILSRFVAQFAGPGVAAPQVADDWLNTPGEGQKGAGELELGLRDQVRRLAQTVRKRIQK